MLHKKLLLLLSALLCFVQGNAQTTDQNYPVTAQAFVVAQPNQKLAAYFASNQALTVSLLLKDLTKTSIQAYLRWSIDGPGVHLSSIDGHIPARFITLQRGIMQRLSGLELQSDYFRSELILAEGLAGSPLRTSLPEGFYTFRVQALEAGTGREVSNWGETYFSITTPLPPVINIPFNGAELSPTDAQKNGAMPVSIQWMPRHYRLPGHITSYDLLVCKVPDGYEPTEALDACVNPIIDDRGNPGTFYPGNTGIGNTSIGAWEVGARYAVRVTIHEFDENGDPILFANEGRSEVTWFRFGKECTAPTAIEVRDLAPGRVQLTWAATGDEGAYQVLYRKAGAPQWTRQEVSGTRAYLSNLTFGDYEFAVKPACLAEFPSYIQTWEVENETDDWEDLPLALTAPMQLPVQATGCQAVTPGKLSDYYANFPGEEPSPSGKLVIPSCALLSSTYTGCSDDHPVVTPPTTGTELTELKTGDVLGIYDFAVFVTEAVATPEGFTGRGLVRLPFLNGALTLADFSGVRAWKTEGNGGCVYASTRFESKGQTQEEAMAARSKLMTALAGQNSPNTYAGTLAGALQQYDALSRTGDTLALCPYKAAILQASGVFKAALEEASGDDPDPRVTDLLKELDGITSRLRSDTVSLGLTSQYEVLFGKLELLKKQLQEENQPPASLISNVTVSDLTPSSALISWQVSRSDITRYVVEYRDPSGGVLLETVENPQVNLQRLKENTLYHFQILAYQGDEVVATYGEDHFMTPVKTLPKPENLAYTIVSDNSVTITWDKNTRHKDFKLVYTDGKGNWNAVYPTTNQATLTGLDPSQVYTYEIVAYDNARLESEAASSQVTTAEQCKLGVSVLNARNSSDYTGNTHVLTPTGCKASDANPNLPTSIQWSNGTKGTVNKNGIITFADGEVGEFVLRSFRLALKINPTKNKSYTAICTMGEGAGKKTCTYTVDVKVPSGECGGDFRIAGSISDLKDQDSILTVESATNIALKATGCTGDLKWSSNLGSTSNVNIIANTEMVVYAQCTENQNICYSNIINIRIKSGCAEIFLKDSNVTIWQKRNLTIGVKGCISGTIWRYEGEAEVVENKDDFYSLKDVKGNIDVFASCSGSSCPETSLKILRPSIECNGLKIDFNRSFQQEKVRIFSEKGEFILSNKIQQFNLQPEDTVYVPNLSPNNIYTATFKNGCQSTLFVPNEFNTVLLSKALITNNTYNITSIVNDDSYVTEIRTSSKCPGKLIWKNDQDPSFNVESSYLAFRKEGPPRYLNYPKVTTQYSATCFADDGTVYAASNPKTFLVTSEKCLEVVGKTTIIKGEQIHLELTGCFGKASWTKDGANFSGGNKLTDLPMKTTTYVVKCDYPECSLTQLVTVAPCSLVLEANKASEKQGDEITLKASNCSTTIVWQDQSGSFLGAGAVLKIAPKETVTVQAFCNLTDCKSTLTVAVPQVLPSKILCEELVAVAQPAIVNKGELNSITLTASGCTGGQTQWNGPGLAENTIGEGVNQQVVAKEVRDSARYSVTCAKDVVGTTQAEVKVKAQLRLVVSASPTSVEKGKTTTLTAIGCGGGTITWQGTNKSCSSPCILENQVINEAKTFTAICNSGGEVLTKSITVALKVVATGSSGHDYTAVYGSGCSAFMGYAYPADITLVPSYQPGVKIKLEAENCSGQVTWEIMDSTRIYGVFHYPRKTTVYVANCIVNNQLCAKSYRLVEIYDFKCNDFRVTYEEKPGGVFNFYPAWCSSTNPNSSAVRKVNLYNSSGFLTKEIAEGQTYDYKPAELANGAVEFTCQPDTRYPSRICYYTFYFDEKSKIEWIELKPYSFGGNIRVGNEANVELAANTASAAPCQNQYNLADLMRNYFSMLVCAVIDEYAGADQELTVSEARIFLDNLEKAFKGNPALKNYLLDLSAVTADDLVAAMKTERPCEEAGELLSRIMPGKQSNEVFNSVLRNTFTDIVKKMDFKPTCPSNALAAPFQPGLPSSNGQVNFISAQFNSSSRRFQFKLNDGFETLGGTNTIRITAVPVGVAVSWLGDYIAYFSSTNPNQFLGFYKVNYSADSSCTPAYEITENGQCKNLCREGFLPEEFYRGKNKFYDDFISTKGKYYSVSHPQPLLTEIEILVESLMDQDIYEKFLRAGAEKLIEQRQLKEITGEDLQSLRSMLTDYKQAMVSMYGNVNSGMMGQVMTFFKSYFGLCGSVSSDSTDCALGEYIIPRCWWDNSIVDVGVPVSIPLTAGIIDGAYSTLYGLGQLTGAIVSMKALAECWFNPLTYIWGNRECSARRASTIQSLIFIKDLIDKDAKANSAVSSFVNEVGTNLTAWKDQTFCFGETATQGRCCSYHQGKLVFDIASLFFGVGEVKAGLQGFKLGTFLEGKIATQMTGLLRKIKLPTSLTMKPIRKAGMAIGTAAMLAYTDPVLVIKPVTAGVQALVVKTTSKASSQTMSRVGEMLQEGTTKAVNEAVGSLDDIGLKITDEFGEEVLKNAGKIIFTQKTPIDDIIISHVNKSNVLSPFAVLTLAGALSRISETGTPGCEVCKTRSKAICDKYLEVRNRAVSGGLSRAEADTAVNRMCAAISTDAGLQEVAGILLTNSTNYMPSLAAMVSFLKDINKNFGKNGIDGNLASFVDSRWFRAWTVVFKARCTGVSNCNENTKADWAVLEPVDEMLEAPSIRVDYVGGYDGLVEVIKKNNRAPCNTCGPPSVSYLNKTDQYLKDIIYFISEFRNTNGADKVLGRQGIRNNSRHQVEATAFILRVLNEKKIRGSEISSFEERVESINDAGEANTVFADIVTTIENLGYGYNNPQTLIECKSWAADGIAFQKFVKGDGNAYKQFKNYLSSIWAIQKVEYWFDRRKANPDQIKGRFQELMYKNGALTAQGVDIFNVIWGNTSLRENLFGRIAQQDLNIQKPIKISIFKDWVMSFDNKVFGFIGTR